MPSPQHKILLFEMLVNIHNITNEISKKKKKLKSALTKRFVHAKTQ